MPNAALQWPSGALEVERESFRKEGPDFSGKVGVFQPNHSHEPTPFHERETANWAGNSPNVIHRHYKALVKEADAKEFWEITSDNVAQIIPMPTPAAAAAAK